MTLLQTANNLGQRIPEFHDQVGSARESIDTLIVLVVLDEGPTSATERSEGADGATANPEV